MVYTCSDDFTFKAIDIRSGNLMYSCKKHEAGVTWLYKYNDTNLISGSYDSTLRIWDERSMKTEVESRSFGGKSIWDVKFNKRGYMSIACIYDGYLLAKDKDYKPLGSAEFNLE